MKLIAYSILILFLCSGCASSDIRNWNPDTKTGQIVVYSGENLMKGITMADAHEYLSESEKCPNGYLVKDLGYRGGGWVQRAKPTTPTTTKSSVNIGGNEVASVTKKTGNNTGEKTIVRAGDLQTQGSSKTDFNTVVRSPENNQSSSGTMWGKWFDFQCK